MNEVIKTSTESAAQKVLVIMPVLTILFDGRQGSRGWIVGWGVVSWRSFGYGQNHRPDDPDRDYPNSLADDDLLWQNVSFIIPFTQCPGFTANSTEPDSGRPGIGNHIFRDVTVLTEINEVALQPYNAGTINTQQFLDTAVSPIKRMDADADHNYRCRLV